MGVKEARGLVGKVMGNHSFSSSVESLLTIVDSSSKSLEMGVKEVRGSADSTTTSPWVAGTVDDDSVVEVVDTLSSSTAIGSGMHKAPRRL